MKFSKQEIVQEPDWTKTVNKVNDLLPKGDWAFRAVEAPPNHKLPQEKDGVFEIVDVSIHSSFDTAWESRSWPTPTPERWRYEAWMLREFKRAAYLYRNTLPAPADYLEWLALARHYEMPSRLVDFTYTFYVASYFASSHKRNETHGFILAINLKELKKKTEANLPSWNFSPPKKEDHDFHNPVIFREFAFEKKLEWVAPVAPSRRNERLLNQHGFFLCPGSIAHSFEHNLHATLTPGNDLKLICLHPNFRTECIQALRQMNIDMRTLYPDLSGFAQSLRDLVHVDIDGTDVRFEEELKRSISASPWDSYQQ
jgi:hypothetical protein